MYFIESSPDQLRIQISKAAKREEKLMQELESVKAQVKLLTVKVFSYFCVNMFNHTYNV